MPGGWNDINPLVRGVLLVGMGVVGTVFAPPVLDALGVEMRGVFADWAAQYYPSPAAYADTEFMVGSTLIMSLQRAEGDPPWVEAGDVLAKRVAEKGIEELHAAVSKGSKRAMHTLSETHRCGIPGVLDPNPELAASYRLSATDLAELDLPPDLMPRSC